VSSLDASTGELLFIPFASHGGESDAIAQNKTSSLAT